MKIKINILNLLVVLLMMFGGNSDILHAQRLAIVSIEEDKPNSINVSMGYTESFDDDVWLNGFGIDYSRKLKGLPIAVTGALMWDKDHPQKKDKKSVRSLAIVASGSYLFGKHFSVGTGISKGIVDDDNNSGKYGFTDGDWATGVVTGYQFSLSKSFTMGMSLTYEWNITANENSLAFDISIGKSF